MLGSARVSRAGDRVLAIANFDVLLVSDSRRHPRQARFAAQEVQRCGFYGSGRVPSRAGFITVSIRYSKVCMEECFGEDAETSTRAAYAPQTVSCRFLAISVRTPTFCRAFRNSDRLRARLR
jgi:hypothetical protein